MGCRALGTGALGSLILGLLGCAQALAQSQSISFDEAMRIALERNAPMRQAQIDVRRNDVDVDEARQQFAPDLALGALGAQNSGRSFNETEGRIVEQTTRSLSLGVFSRLTLVNGFRDVANLRRARSAQQAATLEFERTQETVVFTVAANFLALVQWRELLRVLRDNLAAEMQLEQQIRNFVEAGARAAADLHQQLAKVAAARVDVIEVQSLAATAEVDLMRTLQLDPAGVYDFQPPPQDDPLARPIELNDLLAHAFAGRVDLQAQQARSTAADQGIGVARAAYWPTVSLDMGYGSAYTDASAVGFSDQLDAQRGGSVSINIEIPIFDRGAARSAVRRAQLQALSERVAADEVREQIGLEVRQAYLDYQSARERFDAAEAQQRAAERALLSAQERFKGGASTLVELSDARAGFVKGAGALANARTILNFQRTAIDYFVGDLDPARFTQK